MSIYFSAAKVFWQSYVNITNMSANKKMLFLTYRTNQWMVILPWTVTVTDEIFLSFPQHSTLLMTSVALSCSSCSPTLLSRSDRPASEAHTTL